MKGRCEKFDLPNSSSACKVPLAVASKTVGGRLCCERVTNGGGLPVGVVQDSVDSEGISTVEDSLKAVRNSVDVGL